MSDDSREQHYDWLKQSLDQRSQDMDEAFGVLLKQLHSADPAISDGVLAELWRRADEFAQEIFACYHILTAELDKRAGQGKGDIYNWYYEAFFDAILSMKIKPRQDKTMYVLDQGIRHAHEGMRQIIILRLEKELKRGNKRARTALWQALESEFESPEATQRYRQIYLKCPSR